MGLKFRQDPDLIFLKYCDNEDLDVLVEYLTQNKKGENRLNAQLVKEDKYKEFHPDHQKYWDLIGAELQTYGGNSFANAIRRKGVPYREVLIDVCKKMKVEFNKNSSVETIEQNLLIKILTDSIDEMNEEELIKVVEDLKLNTDLLTNQAVLAELQKTIKKGGLKPFHIAAIVANAIARQLLGRGIAIAGNVAFTRIIGVFAGPIGMAVVGLLAVVDLAGPAYRVTIPSVVQVAYMRAIFNEDE